MGVLSVFDRVYCINLKHRVDRWTQCQEQFERFGIEVVRFEAVNGRTLPLADMDTKAMINFVPEKCFPGVHGCLLSHMSVLQEASNTGLKSIMVFEDDFLLNDDFNEKFQKLFTLVPDDWDTLHVGGNNVSTTKHPKIAVAEGVFRTKGTITTHAIAYRNTSYERLIGMISAKNKPVDCIIADFQAQYDTSYAFIPSIVKQRPSHSDILGRFADVTEYT